MFQLKKKKKKKKKKFVTAVKVFFVAYYWLHCLLRNKLKLVWPRDLVRVSALFESRFLEVQQLIRQWVTS